ncbi:MAG: two-component sensor histidine kinase, partial [Acidobacteria bacterium]|nr:two-component sensor histidine kinase [Acidobacteriota bacterium]
MKWRLLAAFAGLISLVLVAQDIPLAGYLRRIEFERLISSLKSDAFLLAGTSENLLSGEVGDSDTATLTADLQATIDLYAARDGARVVVTDDRGILVVSTDATDTAGEDFSNRPEIATAMSGAPTSGERNSQTAGGNLVYVAVPVLSGADLVGVVRITYRAEVIDTRAWQK